MSWFVVLDGTDYAEDVRNDEELARKLGITGVPCFVFTQLNEGISGAQPPEVLCAAMNRAAQRWTEMGVNEAQRTDTVVNPCHCVCSSQ